MSSLPDRSLEASRHNCDLHFSDFATAGGSCRPYSEVVITPPTSELDPGDLSLKFDMFACSLFVVICCNNLQSLFV